MKNQREILFRGKQKHHRMWLYGYLQNIVKEWYIFRKDGFDSTDNYEIDPNTVGQYTGLKDANGVEIFEGDIVEDTTGVYKVLFKDGCFVIETFQLLSKYCDNMEVIGNIYDNPIGL